MKSVEDVLRERVPARLRPFRLARSSEGEWPRRSLDGHAGDSFNVFRWVGCSCGADLHHIDGWYAEDDGALKAVTSRCGTCSKTSVVFDLDLDGYDAELARLEKPGVVLRPRGRRKMIRFRCVACQGDLARVCARHEYPRDLLDDPSMAPRAENFFTWFSLVGRCSGCKAAIGYGDWECA